MTAYSQDVSGVLRFHHTEICYPDTTSGKTRLYILNEANDVLAAAVAPNEVSNLYADPTLHPLIGVSQTTAEALSIDPEYEGPQNWPNNKSCYYASTQSSAGNGPGDRAAIRKPLNAPRQSEQFPHARSNTHDAVSDGETLAPHMIEHRMIWLC